MLICDTASRADAIWMSSRLREADRQEIAASTGSTPEDAVPLSFDISRECCVFRRESGEPPFAIFGTVPAGEAEGKRVGIVWMLATDEIDDNAIAFARTSRQWAKRLLEPYDYTLNYVWNRNIKHIRWLRWAGYIILMPERRGPFDEWFHPFYMSKQ